LAEHPIIDCHVHLVGAELPDALVAEARRLGVTQMMVASLGRTWDYEPSHAHCVQANRDTLRVMAQLPELVLGWAYVNPRFEDEAEEEIRWCIEGNAFSGVKLWTAAHATEPCVSRIIDLAVELRVPVLMHAWHKATGNLRFESTPQMIAELSRAKPEAMIIMAHIGGDWELGSRALENVAASVDTSGSIVEQGIVEESVARLGARRVIFGSDADGVELGVALAKVTAAEIPEEDRAAILCGNMQAMLVARGCSR
jgi:predicted TIM-barrel fold metal-dependent hydrolase